MSTSTATAAMDNVETNGASDDIDTVKESHEATPAVVTLTTTNATTTTTTTTQDVIVSEPTTEMIVNSSEQVIETVDTSDTVVTTKEEVTAAAVPPPNLNCVESPVAKDDALSPTVPEIPQPPATWHLLQPLVVSSEPFASLSSSTPTIASTKRTEETPLVIYMHQPITVNQPPERSESDRTLRRPTLLRYSMTLPSQNQTATASLWYFDVVDDTEKDLLLASKKRHSVSTGSGGNHAASAAPTTAVKVPTTMTTIEKIPNSIAIQRCTSLYLQQMDDAIQQRQFLYKMTWYAIMEECQLTWYQNTMSTTTSVGNPGMHTSTNKSLSHNETNATAATTTTLTRVPFAYYTEAPSTTSTSMNVATTISNSYEQLYQRDLTLSSVSFTPANLMQRIKQGCHLTYQELQNDTRYHLTHHSIASLNATNSTDAMAAYHLPRRSSTRIVMNQTANVPTSTTTASSNGTDVKTKDGGNTADHASSMMMLRTKHGGRVAFSLLQQQTSSSTETSHIRRRSTATETKTTNSLDDNAGEEGNDIPGIKEEEDEEYEIEPDPTEDDEDEDVEVPKDEVDDNDDEWMGTKNPYLVPDQFALLEWIGKKAARTWSTTDIQSIFATQMVYYDMTQRKKKGRKSQMPGSENVGMNVWDVLTTDTDLYIVCQLLYEQSQDNPHSTFHTLPFMMSSTLTKHEKIVALMNLLFPKSDATSDDSTKLAVVLSGGNVEDIDETIDEWDLSYFCRTQFTIRLLVNESIQNEILYHVEQQAFQQQEAYKEQRQYESYRYRSIQSGYCQWGVSWLHVANEYVTARSKDDHASAGVVPSEEQDLILAQTLAAQLDGENGNVVGESGRRKTRRVGESSGVFYGNQSNLSQKQIMDALLRLISSSKQPYQTLVGLLHALPDDSTDPMKRMRTVIGKLLYKRNQLSRMEVQTIATDSEIWKMLQSEMPPRSSVDVGTDSIVKETPLLVASADVNTNNDADAEVAELMDYVRTLQQTELQLRHLVVQRISEVPIAIIATAGDDRVGSMESMDDVDFEDPTIPITWQTEGSPYLSQRIFRPITKDQDVGESTKCHWFIVTGFVPSVVLPTPATIEPFEKASIGLAREPTAVERRIRFRAVPSDTGTPQSSNLLPLVLTEAQVRAGIKAAELQLSKQQSTSNGSDHPLPSATKPKICLVPMQTLEGTDTNKCIIEGFVVGHDQCIHADSGTIENKILVLPKVGSTRLSSFWTSLIIPTSSSDLGGITCIVNDTQYTVQQFDFHQSSKAFNACMAIVRFLERHPKCIPFLEPVDPVALGIPDYFNVVKHPMDVSTLLKKLEHGDYAHIPPNFMKGQDSVVRMLNGTFRKDVERIFDNAMLFNPPDDWIHQAASVIKKAVVKKIEQASTMSDVHTLGRQRKKNSLYVDYDSDVDMYVYESDYDDNNYSKNRSKRSSTSNSNKPSNGGKHNRGPIKEDAPTRAIERGIRIQKMLNDTLGVRGPLSNLPIQSDPSDFSLPSAWACQHKEKLSTTDGMEVEVSVKNESMASLTTELDELRSLHRLTEENEVLGVRRSTRAVLEQQQEQNALSSSAPALDIEYVCPFKNAPPVIGATSSFSSDRDVEELPRNRLQVELLQEKLHESYFAKLFQSHGMKLMQQQQQQVDDNAAVNDTSLLPFLAEYADGSFPPYLGRVVPMIPLSKETFPEGKPIVQWEIREPYIVPALRWVIRGLLNTEHLVQISDSGSVGNPLRESMLSQNENVLLFPNHVYYIDINSTPFDVLDVKELTRRKKQRNTKSNEDDDSDDDIEMSEYEKARAERMARNKDRLVALGLA